MYGVSLVTDAKANHRVAKGVIRKVCENKIPFRWLAEKAYPDKTAFVLADLTGADERTCKRWLAGDGCVSWSAVSVVLQEIIRRLD